MKRANLIPAARLEQRARLHRVRTWATALGVYAVLAGGAYAACFAFGGGDSEQVLRRTQESADRFREAGKEIRTLRASLAEASKQIAASRSLAQNPDWSLLLAMVSSNLSDDVVLERCFLAPADSAGSGGRNAGPPPGAEVLYQRYLLDLRGFSRTQTGASQFVLRLERSRLFESVRLVRTHKAQFLDGQAVTFRIECVLNGKGGPEK
jgi:hypothetical protein